MRTTASRFSPTALLLLALCAPAGPAAAQAETESHTFDSDGVRLHYIDQGAGEPVLLIHGFALDLGINWVGPEIVSALTDAGYRVVAYDARGHGASEKPHDPAAYGPPDLEDPIRLLDHLGIARAHLIGYSRGGHIAHHLRATHPARLRSVILGGFGAGAGPQAGPDSAMRATLADALVAEDFRPLVRAVTTDASPEEVEAWQGRLAERNDGRALAAAFLAPSFPGFDAEELRTNRVPTLAVIGERDAFRDGVERMREAMSGLEVLVLAGADHASALTDPGFVTALLGFLTKHSEAGSVAGAGQSLDDEERM